MIENKGALPLQAGDVVAGRIRIDSVLGVGGMGAVYAGQDLVTGGAVALKTLLVGLNKPEELVRRFLREANALKRLNSQHAVRIHGTGTLPSGMPFIIMEQLRGEDLRYVVARRGSVSLAEATEWVTQTCEALAEAHALGIVHRDLKLSNIFLTRRPDGKDCIKVLDFGIAKFLSPHAAGDDFEMTQMNTRLGARVYMSPEQMLAPKSVDCRADIWALGVILHYLLSGELPFRGITPEQVVFNMLQSEPVPVTRVRPDVPKRIEEIILRCLQKDPAARYPSVIGLMRTLSVFTSRCDMLATLPVGTPIAEAVMQGPFAKKLGSTVVMRREQTSDPPPAIEVPREESSSVPPPPKRRRMTGALTFGAVLGVCFGIGAYAGTTRIDIPEYVRTAVAGRPAAAAPAIAEDAGGGGQPEIPVTDIAPDPDAVIASDGDAGPSASADNTTPAP